MHRLEYSNQAKKFLKNLDKHLLERILAWLELLTEISIPSDSKFLGRNNEGDKIFRFRIGAYRALYLYDEANKIVLITNIDKRPRVYDQLLGPMMSIILSRSLNLPILK